MIDFIIKHKVLLFTFSLLLINTNYSQKSIELTQEQKVLQIKKSLDKTEQGIIEVNKILDDPYYKYKIK